MIAARGLSLAARLTLLFAATSSGVLVVLGLLIGATMERHFEEIDRALLSGKLQLIGHALARTPMRDASGDLPRRLHDALVGHDGLAVHVAGRDGGTLFTNSETRFPSALLERDRPVAADAPIVWTQGAASFRGISAIFPAMAAGEPPLLVGIATEITHHEAFLATFRRALWMFVAGAALSIGLLGWAVSRRALVAPLRAMRDQAAAITAQRLATRLPVASMPPELAELAEALNAMLERLDDGYRRLSDFSSDLAHEFRTPMTNLMTQTQVALSRARTADDYRGVLESNAEEFDRIGRMVSDMLFLAKAENGLAVPRSERVDLAAETRDLFDYYDALAEQRRVALVLEGDGSTTGDRLMLRRAIGNLLSNAIRHSFAGSSVLVTIGETAQHTTLRVENRGDTIPRDHLDRIFDRFHRVDPARRHGSEGVGLGLAITRSIVKAHGGTIDASSSLGKTAFTMRLPGSTRAPRGPAA